ncbi:unnamed protein product [Paramecium octaurelia]|uniref:Uncharacterized protein n=1 Tax=Paramecium octaurelia TaxID=43137 RepID=A0A8S1SNL0_PAROT|nr:unnamed protein product [Paramecium octaurelia]
MRNSSLLTKQTSFYSLQFFLSINRNLQISMSNTIQLIMRNTPQCNVILGDNCFRGQSS